MRKKIFFSVIFLGVLFLLDITKPFEYYMHAEFLLVGVIAVAFILPFSIVFPASIVCGFSFDCVSTGGLLRGIEYPFYVSCIYYVLANLKSVFARRLSAFACILLHIIFVSLQAQRFFFIYSVSFFLQSVLILFLLRYVLRQWTKPLSVESI